MNLQELNTLLKLLRRYKADYGARSPEPIERSIELIEMEIINY